MTKNKKNILVPRLRFPEFKKAGEWKLIQLGDVASTITKKVGSNVCTPYTIVSGIGLISQQEKLGRTIAGNSLKNYIVIQKNDFAYNKSSTKLYPEGFIALYTGSENASVPNSIFICFRVDQDSIVPTFLYNLFLFNIHGKWLKNRIAVGARAHGALQVNTDDLMKTPIPLPAGSESLSEQQKIADCLSSLDDLIDTEIRKLDTLKKHKKGLMQQLFPGEGKTVPALRFPEFKKAGEWKLLFGRDLFSQINNKKHDSNLPVLAITQEYGAVPRDIINYHVSVAQKSLEAYKIVDVGDFIISLRSFQGGVEFSNYRGICSPAYVVLRLRDVYSKDYFRHYLKTDRFIVRMTKNIEGLRDGKMVSYKQFSELELHVPRNREQQKIADCLSSLDELVSAQSRKVEILKAHKKGLMQQLFPVV